MVKITGLDKLTKQLDEAQRAIESLDGELATVSYDPNDPASIEAAISDIELVVDGRLAAYDSNPIIQPLIIALKERYRGVIIERAAAARIEGNA